MGSRPTTDEGPGRAVPAVPAEAATARLATGEATGGAAPGGPGESEALAWLARRLPPAPPGEVHLGDDAAVLTGAGARYLFCTDVVVEGVHFDLAYLSGADVGWKALAVNVSDIAAMGGRPLHAVVSVAGADAALLAGLYEGLSEASARYGCPLVGGDLSAGPALFVSVAVTGTTDGRRAVLRSGASPGDVLYVTGPLGRSAAGLELLRSGDTSSTAASDDCRAAHRRPVARVAEGTAAALGGATAMIDVSDGLGADLEHLAASSGVGIELDDVPVAPGATAEQALEGGEDFELVIAAGPGAPLADAFAARGLAPPLRIGRCTAAANERRLRGATVVLGGFEHRLER